MAGRTHAVKMADLPADRMATSPAAGASVSKIPSVKAAPTGGMQTAQSLAAASTPQSTVRNNSPQSLISGNRQPVFKNQAAQAAYRPSTQPLMVRPAQQQQQSAAVTPEYPAPTGPPTTNPQQGAYAGATSKFLSPLQKPPQQQPPVYGAPPKTPPPSPWAPKTPSPSEMPTTAQGWSQYVKSQYGGSTAPAGMPMPQGQTAQLPDYSGDFSKYKDAIPNIKARDASGAAVDLRDPKVKDFYESERTARSKMEALGADREHLDQYFSPQESARRYVERVGVDFRNEKERAERGGEGLSSFVARTLGDVRPGDDGKWRQTENAHLLGSGPGNLGASMAESAAGIPVAIAGGLTYGVRDLYNRGADSVGIDTQRNFSPLATAGRSVVAPLNYLLGSDIGWNWGQDADMRLSHAAEDGVHQTLRGGSKNTTPSMFGAVFDPRSNTLAPGQMNLAASESNMYANDQTNGASLADRIAAKAMGSIYANSGNAMAAGVMGPMTGGVVTGLGTALDPNSEGTARERMLGGLGQGLGVGFGRVAANPGLSLADATMEHTGAQDVFNRGGNNIRHALGDGTIGNIAGTAFEALPSALGGAITRNPFQLARSILNNRQIAKTVAENLAAKGTAAVVGKTTAQNVAKSFMNPGTAKRYVQKILQDPKAVATAVRDITRGKVTELGSTLRNAIIDKIDDAVETSPLARAVSNRITGEVTQQAEKVPWGKFIAGKGQDIVRGTRNLVSDTAKDPGMFKDMARDVGGGVLDDAKLLAASGGASGFLQSANKAEPTTVDEIMQQNDMKMRKEMPVVDQAEDDLSQSLIDRWRFNEEHGLPTDPAFQAMAIRKYEDVNARRDQNAAGFNKQVADAQRLPPTANQPTNLNDIMAQNGIQMGKPAPSVSPQAAAPPTAAPAAGPTSLEGIMAQNGIQMGKPAPAMGDPAQQQFAAQQAVAQKTENTMTKALPDTWNALKTFATESPEQAKTMLKSTVETVSAAASSDEGKQIISQIQNYGTVPESVDQTNKYNLIRDGFDSDKISDWYGDLGGVEKFALWSGVSMTMLGLMHAMDGGGAMGAMGALLGLGTLGLTMGQSGIFGDGAQEQSEKITKPVGDTAKSWLGSAGGKLMSSPSVMKAVAPLMDHLSDGTVTGLQTAMRQSTDPTTMATVEKLDMLRGGTGGYGILGSLVPQSTVREKAITELQERGLTPEGAVRFVDLWSQR